MAFWPNRASPTRGRRWGRGARLDPVAPSAPAVPPTPRGAAAAHRRGVLTHPPLPGRPLT